MRRPKKTKKNPAGLTKPELAAAARGRARQLTDEQRHALVNLQESLGAGALRVELDGLVLIDTGAQVVMTRPKAEERCSKCGSKNLQHAMWVETNKLRIVDDFGSHDELDSSFCMDCEEHGTHEAVS